MATDPGSGSNRGALLRKPIVWVWTTLIGAIIVALGTGLGGDAYSHLRERISPTVQWQQGGPADGLYIALDCRRCDVGTTADGGGVSITADGVHSAITNSQGHYLLLGVKPGRHDLTVFQYFHSAAGWEDMLAIESYDFYVGPNDEKITIPIWTVPG